LQSVPVYGQDVVRVARWFIFKPKIPIWVILEGLGLENADICHGHWKYLTDIWDKFFTVWVSCTKKNLPILV
jgi:hypothetical protein